MRMDEILYQLYNTGILAIAIMALGIAIIVYLTLRKHSGKKK